MNKPVLQKYIYNILQIRLSYSDVIHIWSSTLYPPSVRVVVFTLQVHNMKSFNVTMLDGSSKVYSHQVQTLSIIILCIFLLIFVTPLHHLIFGCF